MRKMISCGAFETANIPTGYVMGDTGKKLLFFEL